MPMSTEEIHIRPDYVDICMRKGVRTNVPDGHSSNPWRYKFMLHGLHIVVEPQSGNIVKYFWATRDVDAVQECSRRLDRELNG